MKLEEALEQTEKILGRTVNVCEKLAIEAAWENKNYKQTAIGATEGSIKIAAKKLWDELSKRLKKKVKKNTFRPLIENLLEPSDRFEKLQPLKENEFLQPLVAWIEKSKNQEWKEALLSEDANYKATPWEAYTVTLHLIRKFPPQSQEWEARRALGNGIAKILSNWNDPHRSFFYVLDDFSEQLLSSSQGQIMLSIGMVKAGRLEIQSQSSLNKLLQATHPQISWTLAKDWQSLEPSPALFSLIGNSNDWTKKRLIFSLAQEIVKQNRCGRLDKKLSDALLQLFESYREAGNEGIKYLELLDLWLQTRLKYYFANVFGTPQYFPPRIEEIQEFSKKEMGSKIPQLIREPLKVAKILDLRCLDIDIEGSAHQARGRYDTISDSIDQVIKAAGSDISVLSNALVAAMSCHDEGIRWAIGNKLPDLYKISPTLFDDLAPMLLNDENDWAVREAVRALDRIPNLDNNQVIKLADEAAKSITKKSEDYGWDYVLEINEAFQQLRKRYPSLLTARYNISDDGDRISISRKRESN